MGPDPSEPPRAGARVLRANQARALGRSAVRLDVLTQPKKGQDREDDHHETDEIDDTVHEHLLRVGLRIESRALRDSRHTNACRTLPSWIAASGRGAMRARGISHSDA
jgi:hypothetical protein